VDTDVAIGPQPDDSGSLHVQQKKVDGIVQPEEFKTPTGQDAAPVDVIPAVIGHQFLLLQAADNPLAPPTAAELPQIDGDRVRRRSVERITETLGPRRRTFQDGFEIPGKQDRARAVRAFRWNKVKNAADFALPVLPGLPGKDDPAECEQRVLQFPDTHPALAERILGRRREGLVVAQACRQGLLQRGVVEIVGRNRDPSGVR